MFRVLSKPPCNLSIEWTGERRRLLAREEIGDVEALGLAFANGSGQQGVGDIPRGSQTPRDLLYRFKESLRIALAAVGGFLSRPIAA